MHSLHQLPVLILGLGASGLAMARWCARHGADVTVADTREAPPQLAQLQAELPTVRFVSGAFDASLIEGKPIRAVYRSPGLSPAQIAPVVDAARAIGLVVGGELDLFAQALRDIDAQRREAYEAAWAQIQAEHAQAQAVVVQNPVLEESAEPEAQAVEAAIEAPVEAEEAEPAASPPGVEEESAAPVEQLTDTTPAPEPEAATPAAAPAAQAYVPHAAREAAEFVARIAELSAAAPQAEEEQEPLPVAEAAPVLQRPALPEGYRPAVLAITGTNGKTTVTSLTGLLIESVGKSVAVAGNIGPTLLDTLAGHLDAGTLPEAWVLELSSFQLDGVQGFEPTAATVLNITQDHLDWHGDMASYAAAKARIFGQTGLMVLNREDAAVMGMLPPPVKVKLQKPQIRAHITFGADLPQRPGDFGIERVNGMAWLVRAHEADETQKRKRGAVQEEDIHLQRLMPADALRIRGQHNALNALAALALAASAGCALAPMLYGLRDYRGEPHRVEPIALIDDVEYFDDSKGTNVGATVAALAGLGVERKLVVILGGDGKGQDFTPLAEPVARYVRAAVLIGRDAPQIESALADTGVPLLHAADMDAAVRAAARQAHTGDAVLLSPACASFDMFRGYGHRAEVFIAAVQALADDPEPAAEGESA
ncbi:UDP-N-acetylmuramoyl-L-alanine--D-glutamate ligase [Xenophilus arseniciresistens]|uniref:UDP-N-acetylmuramoylalanine--D-glutamate ligase n=1 Tax=Xenophilus arseniciresistens TaxID=1283306 RepID=A0AAE3NB19_9BURK|nr:UDP-N-acetylmuramoyl-L-alanine--D-glutamate ligase [Xenophilus arseniciresistens]MDA7417879.1 UDP-N-acetylmuramoyl-L-alanine--D-glutamate ligase [Xenophilus arseniciresistens]